jgi:hypothetical protein
MSVCAERTSAPRIANHTAVTALVHRRTWKPETFIKLLLKLSMLFPFELFVQAPA